MTAARILAVVVVASGAAEAGPLADRIATHTAADASALRAQLPDPAARCALGVVYARRHDLSRAMLFLDGCADATLPDDIAADVARTVRDTKKQVRASELGELSIATKPDGMTATVDALPGEQLATPGTVWVKAGTLTVRATTAAGVVLERTVEVKPYSRSMVMLEAPVVTTSTGPTNLDFSDEGAAEQTSGPPPDIKRPSLIRGKLLGVAGPRVGPELDDPFATRHATGARPWFGLRIGGGVFDDGASTAAYRPSVAATARFAVSDIAFVAARLDWSRRGGSATSIDTAGASLGAGVTVLALPAFEVAVIAQLRADLRFADPQMSAPRAGVAGAGDLELAFPSTPVTAGLRFEEGFTDLIAGRRDRALLVELGVDWR